MVTCVWFSVVLSSFLRFGCQPNDREFDRASLQSHDTLERNGSGKSASLIIHFRTYHVSVIADTFVSFNELNKSPFTSKFLAPAHNQYGSQMF